MLLIPVTNRADIPYLQKFQFTAGGVKWISLMYFQMTVKLIVLSNCQLTQSFVKWIWKNKKLHEPNGNKFDSNNSNCLNFYIKKMFIKNKNRDNKIRDKWNLHCTESQIDIIERRHRLLCLTHLKLSVAITN